MTEERKFAILFAATILAARKLIDVDPNKTNLDPRALRLRHRLSRPLSFSPVLFTTAHPNAAGVEFIRKNDAGPNKRAVHHRWSGGLRLPLPTQRSDCSRGTRSTYGLPLRSGGLLYFVEERAISGSGIHHRISNWRTHSASGTTTLSIHFSACETTSDC